MSSHLPKYRQLNGDPSLPAGDVKSSGNYGVKSSGNQAESALEKRETAAISKDEYPEAFRIISQDAYVDDCISGEDSNELALQGADEIEISFNKGGLTLK